MFKWFGKASLPPLAAENPGRGASVRLALSNGERSWHETTDLVAVLAQVIEERGLEVNRGPDWLELPNGLLIRPQIENVESRDDGGLRTVTTIDVNHAQLCESGVFEFQHSSGDTLPESCRAGFEGWANTDLPVFMEALDPSFEPRNTMRLRLQKNGRRREVVLGPPVRAMRRAEGAAEADGEEHDFCPCCLFTNCNTAFEDQLFGSDAFFGLRLFAVRDGDGEPDADCRINGLDAPAGKEALIAYVADWPARGFEYRKQFVAIRTLAADEPELPGS